MGASWGAFLNSALGWRRAGERYNPKASFRCRPAARARRAITGTRYGCGWGQEKREARPPIAVGRAGSRRLLRRRREGEMMARAAAAGTFCIGGGGDVW